MISSLTGFCFDNKPQFKNKTVLKIAPTLLPKLKNHAAYFKVLRYCMKFNCNLEENPNIFIAHGHNI